MHMVRTSSQTSRAIRSMTAPRSACALDAATAVRMEYKLRLAALEDVPALNELIARSIHGLGAADYTQAQIEAALQGAFGVDTGLIRDGTLFVAETHARGIVACGG